MSILYRWFSPQKFTDMNDMFLDLFKSLKMNDTRPCIPTKQKKAYLCLVGIIPYRRRSHSSNIFRHFKLHEDDNWPVAFTHLVITTFPFYSCHPFQTRCCCLLFALWKSCHLKCYAQSPQRLKKCATYLGSYERWPCQVVRLAGIG